jgi:hypothetical protein
MTSTAGAPDSPGQRHHHQHLTRARAIQAHQAHQRPRAIPAQVWPALAVYGPVFGLFANFFEVFGYPQGCATLFLGLNRPPNTVQLARIATKKPVWVLVSALPNGLIQANGTRSITRAGLVQVRSKSSPTIYPFRFFANFWGLWIKWPFPAREGTFREFFREFYLRLILSFLFYPHQT